MSTTVLLRSEIDLKIQTLLSEAQEKVDGLLGRKLSFLYGDNPIQAAPSDALRIITELVSDDPRDQTLKNLLLNTIVTSESLWAGSGFISLLVLLEASKSFRKNRILRANPSYDLELLTEEICRCSRRVCSEDIFSSLAQISKSQYELQLIKETLEIAGSSATASVTDKMGLSTSIVPHSGYTIKVSPDHLFWSASEASLISLYNSKIVCIDGIIESVSEIHNLMDQSFRTGQSIVIFARGFNEDVTNTLAVNHGKGMLNVIPVVVPYDLVGVNQLVDIAVCGGSDVVSSLKGELISTIEWEDLKEIERIKITPKLSVIENSKVDNRVKQHKRQIQRKINNLSNTSLLCDSENANSAASRAQRESIEEQRDILKERMMSLVSSGVKITLGQEHGSARGVRQDRVQTLLRMYGQASKHGLVNLEELDRGKLQPVTLKVIDKLIENSLTKISPPAILCAFKVGITNARMIQKIGAWLTIDEE